MLYKYEYIVRRKCSPGSVCLVADSRYSEWPPRRLHYRNTLITSNYIAKVADVIATSDYASGIVFIESVKDIYLYTNV